MRLFIVINTFLVSIFFATTSIAYNTEDSVALDQDGNELKGGHEKMADWSFRLNGVPLSINTQAIRAGTRDEDSGNNPLRHFYNPSTGKGLPGFQNAKERAVGVYDSAVKTYRNGGTSAYFQLGHALHLLQDMAAPSHANSATHFWQSQIGKTGYEWWVTRYWDGKINPHLTILQNGGWLAPIIAGDMAGYMETLSTQTHYGGFVFDDDFAHTIPAENTKNFNRNIVSDSDSEGMSMFLVPAAVKMGAGLLKTFCKDVNCGGPTPPLPNNTGPGGGHPDDNFDVSSRLIELEELDVTKQAWKDIYGRTGIKKGYNGLFLEKVVTEAYAKIAATTTETEYNTAAQQFGLVLDKAQKEAKHSFEDTYYASADVAVLSEGFVGNTAEMLLKRLKEPIREIKQTFTPSALLPSQPVLIIPSGGLAGYENSTLLKSTLDEYVKQGGTLVVLAQKHGYDYASVPTPDGKPITAYGWEEDQNCFADSVAIETWHQILSGQSRSTPTLNVDGYFMGYPPNSTILLRRTANGQPAMIMYEHGAGRVIATSMYSDWAYGHGQASAEETALVRDMLAWAKKPAVLPEIKPGETVSVPLILTNSTSTDAASMKFQIWNPDRTTLLSEQTAGAPIPAGEAATIPFIWQVPANAALGIYHIDYILLDSGGNIIQPQAETDSGRFAVVKPPQIQTPAPGIRFSITSPTQQVFFNEPFAYTFHVFNDTSQPRNLTIKTWLPHTDRRHEWTVTANPNSEAQITGSDLFIDSRYMFETLRAYLYDENGTQIGSYMLSFKGLYPKVDVTTSTGKTTYTKGGTVNLAINLQNKQNAATTVNMNVRATDPSNGLAYNTVLPVSIAPNATETRSLSFVLPTTAQGGTYTLATELNDSTNNKIGGDSASFELPLSQISVIPTLPTSFAAGANTVSFQLVNGGKININSGTISAILKDPEGVTVATLSQPFALAAGQNTTLDTPLNIPALKFGVYTLSYTQSDETKIGKPVNISLANTVAISASFDKSSYRIRETINLNLGLTNSGRFNLNNANITLGMPDAGYADRKTITISQGQAIPLQYSIPLPATMTAGQHALAVTVELQDGSSITQSAIITVPQPSLAVIHTGAETIHAGETVTLTIENIGGIDTSYSTSNFTLADSTGMTLYQGNASGFLMAGEKKALATFAIPGQTASGSAFLNLQATDSVTGKITALYKSLSIAGVKVSLHAVPDQLSYPTTGSITGVATIATGGLPLEGGSLKVTVKNGGSAIPLNGLRLWLKADAGVSKDASGKVAWWADQSGNNLNIVQPTYAKQPLMAENAVNDKPVIRFDGNDDYLQTSGAVNLLNNTGNFSLFVVVKPGATQKTWADILDYQHNPQGLLIQQDGGEINKYFIGGSACPGFGGCSRTHVLDPTKFQVLSAKFRQSSFFYSYLNGSDMKYLGNAYTRLDDEPKYFTVGNKSLELYPRQFNGSIAEIIIYNTVLSETEMIAVDRYLFSKYAIDAVPPQTNDTLFDTVIPVTQSANSTSNYNANIGVLNVTGKLFINTELKNSLGQVIGTTESPFYIVNGSTLLTFNPDKKLYKPGETVTVSGEVRNLGTADASNLTLTLKTKDTSKIVTTIHKESLTVPAGSSRLFVATTVAGSDGQVALTAIVIQNGSTLAEIVDRYEVASPSVITTLTAPDTTGNDPFTISLGLTNGGTTDATITVAKSFASPPETVTIPAGQTRLLQPPMQIMSSP